ncbi:WD40 repeat domain-containing protein [Sulfuricurvum sp.]|uniref:WD40 repeat domain-containing protein n=1 Tax=Sulfuricurvum sp. TaxID=2025608 RepID=UPI003BB78449
MRFFLFTLFFSLTLYAGVISPKVSVKTSSAVLDFIVRGGDIWAGTANGEALRITSKGKIISTTALPVMEDSWGEKIKQKIMSIDLSSDTKTLIVAGEDGWLYTIREGKITKTVYSTKTVVKKIAFISDTKVMLALLSNEVVFFDLKTNRVVKTLSGGTSPLSDMALSKDKKTALIAGEAGIVSVIDTGLMKITRRIQGGNVDNIYKVDIQNNRVLTAGQDRRAILYTLDGKSYIRFNGSFLIYTAALSPSAGVMAATMDEENLISVFDTHKRQKIATAKGHSATLNRIIFIDEKRFVSCADENKILVWELP